MMKNKYVIDGDTLIVYNRKDNREMLFDVDDFDKINQHTWYINGNKIKNEYVKTTTLGKATLAHRWLMNEPFGMLVDHKNGNSLDNRKSNLRIVNDIINNQNNPKAKGYCWDNKNKKYKVQIHANKKQIYLGLYKTEVEARAVYLEAKKKYHPTAPIHLYK